MNFSNLKAGKYIINKINGEYIKTNKNIQNIPHAIYFDLKDSSETLLPSGIYFYQLIIKPHQKTSHAKTFVERLAILR
jgi:hypothetical protein